MSEAKHFVIGWTIGAVGTAVGIAIGSAMLPHPRGEIICSPAGNQVNNISMRGIRQDSVQEAVEGWWRGLRRRRSCGRAR